jgi:hypothetical protein
MSWFMILEARKSKTLELLFGKSLLPNSQSRRWKGGQKKKEATGEEEGERERE